MTKLPHRKPLFVSIAAVIAVCLGAFSSNVHATMVPSLLLSLINNNTQIQLTVIGADPNSAVAFDYPSASSVVSTNLGMTNTNGNFTTTINPSGYNITVGMPIYVIVDGAQSQAVNWPNYSAPAGSSGYLSLSQSNINVIAGQGAVVMISSNVGNVGAVSVTSNTNPSAASVSISGMQAVVNGLSAGSTNATLCAVNAGCTTLYVNVQPVGAAQPSVVSSPSVVSFSQGTVSLIVGQSQVVSMTGPGSFYVSSNTNSSVASTNVNGSTLTVMGLAAGNISLSICSAGNNITSCGAVQVFVTPSNNTPNNTSSTTVYLNPNSLTLNIGQSSTVALSSSQSIGGTYYVNTNSNPSVVTVNVNGSTAQAYGLAFGGSNVSICEVGGNNCANLYVYVNQNSAATPAVTVTTPASLSSFSVSTADVNHAFMSAGDVLTFTFSANQSVSAPVVTINGVQVQAYGSGSGPYTVNYTVIGNESVPMPVLVLFTGSSGQTYKANFQIGASASVPTVSSSCPTGYTCAANSVAGVSSGGAYSFSSYLYMGMTPTGVSNHDVEALQKRLAADGIYSGPITGYFGPLTKAAVEAYQTKHGLGAIGVIGPATRALLNEGI